MNLEEDLSSDTSDDDYVPSGGEAPSSDESGEDICDDELQQDDAEHDDKVSNVKRKQTAKTKRKLKQKSGQPTDEKTESLTATPVEEADPEAAKKKADSLWADFMKDVGNVGRPPAKSTPSTVKSIDTSTAVVEKKSSVSSGTSATIKEFNFAGETIRISADGSTQQTQSQSMSVSKSVASANNTESSQGATTTSSLSATKRPAVGGGGLGSVLSMIGKKPKISTLEKSKLDWNDFKKNEGIEEDLAVFNRGKHGYLERQAFLQRSDERQFEQERDVRMKQMNMRK